VQDQRSSLAYGLIVSKMCHACCTQKQRSLTIAGSLLVEKIYHFVSTVLDKEWTKWLEAWENCVEELHNLYFSPDIIWTIESRRMRWTGREAGTETLANAYRFWWVKLKGRDSSEDLVVDVSKLKLKWLSSVILSHVVWYRFTDVSEALAASIVPTLVRDYTSLQPRRQPS
jgi:hypothetical protein